MGDYVEVNIILDDNDETRNFARKVIRELNESPTDYDSILETARETYKVERHADILGNKKLREMENARLIWKNNGTYRATTMGIEA